MLLIEKKPVLARNNRFLDPDTTGQDELSWIGSIMLTLDQDLDEKTRLKKKHLNLNNFIDG